MRFSVKERLLLMGALPPLGDAKTMRIALDLHRDLSFSETEHADLQFKIEGEQTRWSSAADPNKDVEIGPVGLALLRPGYLKLLARLNEQKMIGMNHIILADKLGCGDVDLDTGAPEVQDELESNDL